MSDQPANLCVLADQYLMTNEVRSLERAIEKTDISIPLVVVNDPVNPDIDPEAEANAINNPIGIDTVLFLFDILKHERAWTFVYAERKLSEALGSKVESLDRVHVEDVACLSESDIRYVTPIMDGEWAELPPDAVELVRERCDVAVRFGFNLLKGDVLRAPEFGVLSFHLADIRKYRGLGVQQAWADGRDTMGVTLQRLSEDIDGGEIIAYGETDVRACMTLWDAYDTLHNLKVELLAEGIENLRDPSFEPTVPESLGPYNSVKKRHDPSFAGRVLLKNIAGRLDRVIAT